MTDAGPPPPRPRRARTHHPAAVATRLGLPLAAIGGLSLLAGNPMAPPSPPPSPTPVAAPAAQPGAPLAPLAAGKPVEWWFAYKFSASSFPGADNDPARRCPFGGQERHDAYSQRYVFASNLQQDLTDGPGLIGTSNGDPLGATFGAIFGGGYYYVTWNDQFYNDPPRTGAACDKTQCGKPWGHSKGILAWDVTGAGVLLQVTTPSWPGSGSSQRPRADGNTLGCISDDNNASNAQDFFALKLDRDDVKTVLRALARASVSTDINNPQIVNRRIGGTATPADIDSLVGALGNVSTDKTYMDERLSNGVRMIVKPSALHVPPWQFVSSVMGGEPLRTATWWAYPKIVSTRSAADVHCWDASLGTPPGEVDVATSGSWKGTKVAFTGGPNHAKVGVSLAAGHHLAIFGDLNQQGQLGQAGAPNGDSCDSSQNGRGGMFFVVDSQGLSEGLTSLMSGDTAPYPN